MATISRMPISVSCEIINTVALRLCVHARSKIVINLYSAEHGYYQQDANQREL